MSKELHDFLESKFGLFLLGSVALPLILTTWEYVKTCLARRERTAHLARVAIWRYTLVQDGCRPRHLDGFRHAIGVLRGQAPYRPLRPDLEEDLPLSGLVMQLLPKREFETIRPEAISRLMELEAILHEIAEADAQGLAKLLASKEDRLTKTLSRIERDQSRLIPYVT